MRDERHIRAALSAGLHAAAAHGEICLAGPVRLKRGRVHEGTGDSADIFALSVAAASSGPVLWIGMERSISSLAPTGLQDFIDPGRLILVSGCNRNELLWAAEQALRARCAACVILELMDGPDLRESRRLQISAEQGGSVGIVLIGGRARTSAAETRWHRSAAAGGGWQWVCSKNKSGLPGTWRAAWTGRDHAPDLITLAGSASA